MTNSSSCSEIYNVSSIDCQISKKIRRFSCNQCSGTFRSRQDLDRHISSIHDGTVRFFCIEAGCRRAFNGFKRKDHMWAHHRRMHGYQTNHQTSARPAARIVGTETFTEEKGNANLSLLSTYTRGALAQMVIIERRKREETEVELKRLKGR